MLFKAIAALAFSMLFCAGGSAQVFFEPVQSQYHVGNQTYFYGGSNLRVFQYANQRLDCTRFGYLNCGLISRPTETVYVDGFPRQNAAIYGYTSNDARDTANGAVPRFFRMTDLLLAARPAGDGQTLVVPAQAPGTIDIRPTRTVAPPTTGPSAQPKPVMIIPKKLLEPGILRDRVADAK